MGEYTWIIEIVIATVLALLGWSLKGNFDVLAASVEKVTKIAGEISAKMTGFEIHMENTNKHIESIVTKMDKVDAHETRLALIEHNQEDCRAKHSEIDKRIRDLEYANAKNSNS